MEDTNSNTDPDERELSAEDMIRGIGRKATDEELIDYLSKNSGTPISLETDFANMRISDYSFHDSKILEVRELPEQIMELFLDFPVDWDNNIFEPRILRFIDVIHYSVNSIPFVGTHTIMEINELGTVKREFGSGRNAINTERNKIEIITTAGERTIEYINCELITPPNH